MQLEAVRRVPMCDLGLEVRGQVDDIDGIKWALLRTDTTSYAKALGDEGDFGVGCDFDAQFARADHRARLLAFLSAFLRLALVRVDNGNTSQLVRHGGGSVNQLRFEMCGLKEKSSEVGEF